MGIVTVQVPNLWRFTIYIQLDVYFHAIIIRIREKKRFFCFNGYETLGKEEKNKIHKNLNGSHQIMRFTLQTRSACTLF